jgi:L-fuconate dehydratase
VRVTDFEVHDIRFPTSRGLHGSDAMHPDPDYSAAYVVFHTDDPATSGHGYTFTIGRGNEVVVAGIRALAPHVVGRDVAELTTGMGPLARSLARDGQLRWVGPEKGVIHLAASAVLNGAWDLVSKAASQPLWQLVSGLSPEELVDLVDWRYLTDVLTPARALERLKAQEPRRAETIQRLQVEGIPAYTTSAGWIGYTEDEVRRRCRVALASGFTRVKVKVGAGVEADAARLALVRSEVGDIPVMVDANQVWEVDEAIETMRALAEYDLAWIEEPTSPDDILGHAAIARAIAPIPVATGEHCQNRVMFKQFMVAGGMQIAQIDACRLASVNEVLAVLLLAAELDIPVCPHAGGVGLCEYVQHLAAIDAICVTGTTDGRVVEYADPLHEHFVDPVEIRRGSYVLPTAVGYAEMHADSMAAFAYPSGSAWEANSEMSAFGRPSP